MNLPNKSTHDKMNDLLNTQNTRRSSNRSGLYTATGYGHFLVKLLEKAKSDSVIRENLRIFIKGYEIISDFLKFNNETLQKILVQNDRDQDGDIDRYEFLFMFKPLREKDLIDEETLEEFQSTLYNFKSDIT